MNNSGEDLNSHKASPFLKSYYEPVKYNAFLYASVNSKVSILRGDQGHPKMSIQTPQPKDVNPKVFPNPETRWTGVGGMVFSNQMG